MMTNIRINLVIVLLLHLLHITKIMEETHKTRTKEDYYVENVRRIFRVTGHSSLHPTLRK